MADAYRSLLRTVDMTNGENDGTWGDKIDAALLVLEEAIAGEAAIATTGGNTTLTTANNATDQQRKMILRVTGTLTSNATITVPSTTKTYDVFNATAGAYTVTVLVSGETGVAIPQGGAARVAVTSAGDVQLVARRDPTNDFEAADRTKLDGIETGAEVNVGTDLTYTAATRTLNSSTGDNVVLPLAGATGAGLLNAGLVADAGKVLRVAAGGGWEVVTVATGDGDMLRSVYDPANIAEQLVGLTATQTLTNKTLTSPTITGNLALTGSVTMTEGAGSGGAAHSVANNLILDSDQASVGLSLLSPTTGVGYMLFGDSAANTIGEIAYIHSSDTLRLRAGGTNTLYVRNGRIGIGEDDPINPLHITSSGAYARLEASGGVLGGAMAAALNLYAQGNLHGSLGFVGTSAGYMRLENTQGTLGLYADTNNAHANSYIDFNIDGVLMARASLSTAAHWDIGVEDTRQGILQLRGDSTTAGGTARWFNGASNDTTHNYWEAIALSSGLIIRTDDGVWGLQIDDAHNVKINNGDLTVVGSVAIDEGAGSGATAHSTSNNLVIDSDQTSAGLSILTPNTGTGYVVFGDTSDNDAGAVWYIHSSNTLGFRVAGATRVTIDATGIHDDGNDPTASAQLANKQYVDAEIAAAVAAVPTGAAAWTSTTIAAGATLTGLSGVTEIEVRTKSSPSIQLGDSGGIESTGYSLSTADLGGGDASISVTTNSSATEFGHVASGTMKVAIMRLFALSSTEWTAEWTVSSADHVAPGAGIKTLSAAFDRIKNNGSAIAYVRYR